MKTPTNAYYLEAVNRAIEFIEAHTADQIKLEDISAYSYLSKYHFHRIFKSIIGDTTKSYLTRLRLEKSAFLLKNSDKAIHEIAYDCGYASPETFTRAFKLYFSTTPSQFRQTARQQIKYKQQIYQQTSLDALQVIGPKIISLEDLNLAYIRHFGTYDKVGKSFQKLMVWAARHLILQLKPTTLGIVHDNPELTEDAHIRFDACLLITKEIQPKGEVGYKKITGGRFAVFRYTGPYDTFFEVYDYIYHVCLFQHQWQLRDEPALEWYVKSPPFYQPTQFVTDFYLPIV